jgi:hypothetical protein
MAAIVSDDDRFLRRDEVARRLSEAGFPVAKSTLECMAVRGGGPPFRKFGRIPLYKLSEALEWAHARMGEAVQNSSEVT